MATLVPEAFREIILSVTESGGGGGGGGGSQEEKNSKKNLRDQGTCVASISARVRQES